MMLWMLFLLFAALVYTVQNRQERPAFQGLAFADMNIPGDEDVKIAGGHFGTPSRGEDASELAAQDFLRQKTSGNIDRARSLGRRYAQVLMNTDEGPLAEEMAGKSELIHHHQYLLYCYVVNRVIADHSPNSILSQTSSSIFYSEIESASPELYRHISDTAAFSLYILCERSKNRSDDDIGRVFAGLCGAENDGKLVQYGNRLYDLLYDFCVEEIRKTAYAEA